MWIFFEIMVLMDITQVGGFFPAMARLAKSTEPDPSLEEGFIQAVIRQNALRIIFSASIS